MHTSYTVPAKSVRNVINAVSQRIRPIDLCEMAGLDATHLNNPFARVLFSQLVSLYESAARLTQDQSFGLHVGERTDFRGFDALGYIVLNSPTLGDALDRVARYFPIWTDGATFRLDTDGASARLSWEYADPCILECRHDCEMTLLVVARIGRTLLRDGGWKPREVRFQHSRPRDISEHRRLFGAPVNFRMPTNEIIFDRSTLAAPLRNPDRELCNLLMRYADTLMAPIPRTPRLTDRAKTAIFFAVREHDPRLTTVARKLGLGSRTLQRRLRADGSTYRSLLGQVREQLAKKYLSEDDKPLSEIAYRLGFGHATEFHRAFRNRTGTTPRRFRKETPAVEPAFRP